MKDFRTLNVWTKSHQLALTVYKVTEPFPPAERYGVTSQIRRAATSIPANIAEGCGRTGDRELARYLRMAMGSASELEYHILLARDLNLLPPPEYKILHEAVVEVKRMLAGLIRQVARG